MTSLKKKEMIKDLKNVNIESETDQIEIVAASSVIKIGMYNLIQSRFQNDFFLLLDLLLLSRCYIHADVLELDAIIAQNDGDMYVGAMIGIRF